MRFFSRFIIGILVFQLSNSFVGLCAEGVADDLLGENAKRISMDFTDASLRDVLKIFSQQSGLNFVASNDVEDQKVNLFLDQVSVQDALDSIIGANNLRYERKTGSKIFIVHPKISRTDNLETKVFFLKYKRLSSSAMDVGGQSVISDLATAEEGGSSGSGESSSASVSSGSFAVPGGGGGSSSGGGGDGDVAGRGIDAIVTKLLSASGKMAVDIHTNSLIITDRPEILSVVEQVLSQIDVPSKQVMLEVQILEVNSSVVQDTGVDWGGTDGALLQFTGGSRSTTFPFQEALFNSFDAQTGAQSAVTLGTLSAANFTFVLRYLVTQSQTKILARPRVLTINNEAAIIKLSTQTSIAKVSEQSASEGVSVTTSDTAEREETGIVLKMTPQINQDASVEMYLEPSITTVSPSDFFSTDFLDPTTRSVRTTVRVFDHETIVIGGLIDSDKSRSKKKIPFLGDLPYVGKAFQYEDKDESDRELLIFITPHIIDVDENRRAGAPNAGRVLEMTRTLEEDMAPVKEREQIIEDALIKAYQKEHSSSDSSGSDRPDITPGNRVDIQAREVVQPVGGSRYSREELLRLIKQTTQPERRAELLREWARLSRA